MPEGPSLIIFREELLRFTGQKITAISGSSKIDQQRLVGRQINEIATWGKHMLLCFDDFTIRIHFLMFGTYYINSSKDRIPRLSIQFERDHLNLYACGVRMVEEPLDEIYDWEADVLSPLWNPKKARTKLKGIPETLVTDALLDQTIFSGVGNIIKNEVLHITKIHPLSKVGALPPRQMTHLIEQASAYSYQFLQWKREGVLRRNWAVHKKKICPRDETIITKEHLGKTDRRTFYCNACQKLYEL